MGSGPTLATVIALALFAGPALAEPPARGKTASELRAYANQLATELERTRAERDAALADLEKERATAKRALDKVLGHAVIREAELAAAKRRGTSLAAEVEHAGRERERLLAEIVRQAETNALADVEQGRRLAELVDRLRSVELDRAEAERLGDEARSHAGMLATELATVQAQVLTLEERLAESAAVRVRMKAPETGAERIATLEGELAETRARATELERQQSADRRELKALRTARAGLESALAEARERAPVVLDTEHPEGLATEDPTELHRQLTLERERRTTLETELVRLSTAGDAADRNDETWRALQSARAEILVLTQRLDVERSAREELEGLLARAKAAMPGDAGGDPKALERLIEVAESHGRDTDQLEADLRDANDQISRLKGHLETLQSPDGGGAAMLALDEENDRLEKALRSAEARVGRLSGQAALARRLAEIVYSR